MPYNETSSFGDAQKEMGEWDAGPLNKNSSKPAEMMKAIAAQSIEFHQWDNYHNFMQSTQNEELRKLFAKISADEEGHFSMASSLWDPQTTPIEAAIAAQMTAVHALAQTAQLERDRTCKQAYDYILADHVGQLYTICDMADSAGTDPQSILQGEIDIQQGRPIDQQIVTNEDVIKDPGSKEALTQSSLVNMHAILAAEYGLHNSFQTFRMHESDKKFRQIFHQVTAIENLHISMLDTMVDPTTSLLEYVLASELAEIRIHKLGIEMSTHKSAQQVHEHALEEDRQHLEWLCDAYEAQGGDVSMFQESDELFQTPEGSVSDYIRQNIKSAQQTKPEGTGWSQAA